MATCSVPHCNRDARLYPAGWLCDDHCPAVTGAARIPRPRRRTLMPPDADQIFETEQHALMDANLARLRQEDADLDRIFEVGFAEAYREGRRGQLRGQLVEYADLTHRQGRLIDYHRLFAGLDQ
ncbi:hypothetical protein [Kitasatospora purpeofusca]|uniref:hypothetical protein n=1 Tax=Kitasatospora purpeofusca TaxID=67352 RepID=UPI0037FDDF6B